jgi:hypothetical protein
MEIIVGDFDKEPPAYPSPVAVGETVRVNGTLSTSGSNGGTVILVHATTECVVTKAFWDYETGWRYWGHVDDPATVATFRQQGDSEYTLEHYAEKYGEASDIYRNVKEGRSKYDPASVRFSEFDIAK